MVIRSSPGGPTLGARYQPFGAHLQDPYPFYAELRRHEPVTFSPALGAWVLTRYEDILGIVHDPETFSSRNTLRPVVRFHPATLGELWAAYPPAPSIPSSDGALHARLLAPVGQALAADKVGALVPFMRERATALVDAFIDAGQAELMDQYANPLPLETLARLLDLDPEDRADVTRQAYEAGAMSAADLPEPEQAMAAREYVAFQHLLVDYIEARRLGPRDDLISQVVTALAPGDAPLTLEQQAELVAVLSTPVLAGSASTSAQLGTGIYHLLSDRSWWELLCERPDLIPAAVEEMTRFDSAVQGFFRITTRPVTVGGVELPADAELLLLYGSANRDEALTEQPDEFDIHRGPTHHLGYGIGLHACTGANLAPVQLEIALETLLQRLPTLRLAAGTAIEMRPGLLQRGPWTLDTEW